MSEDDQRERIDFTSEPKKMYMSFLIQKVNIMFASLYSSSKFTDAVHSIQGTIDSLDDVSQKTFEEDNDRLDKWQSGQLQMTRADFKDIYRRLNQYLHKTYFREVTKGIIQVSTLPTKREKPEAKKHETILPEGID